jgi:hypothetical protein
MGGLEGELSQHATGELARRGRQRRPEQLQRLAEVCTPLAGAAEPEMCFGELALPAGPPEPGLGRQGLLRGRLCTSRAMIGARVGMGGDLRGAGGATCKIAGIAFTGSNPVPATPP